MVSRASRSPDVGFDQSNYSVPRAEFNEIEEGPDNPGERVGLELPPYAHRGTNRSPRVIREPRWIGIHGADLPLAPPPARNEIR